MEYATLTELLADVEPRHQFAFYKRFKAAIRTGEVLAVPTIGSVAIPRTKSALDVPEHLMPKDGKADAWKVSVIESMQKSKTASRRISVSKSDLESGKVDFVEIAARYRASLIPKKATTPKRGGRRKEE